MSIASRIQEIETHIGDVYDTIDYSYDTTGVNKNIINIPKYLKKGYIDIINNGTDNLYSNFPKVSGTGSNLSLTPTYEAPMKLNEIQGDTLQDELPTPDSPVPINSVTGNQEIKVTGKNLINQDTFTLVKGTNRTINISFPTAIQAGTYTLSLNATNVSELTSSYSLGIQGFYGNTKVLDIGNIYQNGIYTKTFTISEQINKLYMYINSNPNLSDTATITIEELQIEKGSSNTDYEPYQSATYEVNLGKNLFDKDNANKLDGYINSAGIITSEATNKTIYIPCKSSTTYTVSKIASTRFGIASYNTTPQIGSTTSNFTRDNSATHLTLTTGSSDTYLVVWYYNSNTDTLTEQEILDSIQIEVGSTATSYSPYFTPIELNKIGTYEDRIYKDSGKWYLEKQIGKVVLNGSENWSENGENTDYGQYTLSINDKQYGNYLLSDKFVAHTGATGNYIWGRSNNNNIYITIAKSIVSYGLTSFKTWLSNNNTTVYYVLATPTTTEITNTELIEDLETLYTAKSQEGTTNISITSEDLEMILNVSALKSE